jgi:hypothetical protein
MATVRISANVTDPACVRVTRQLQQAWQTELTRRGSTGDFHIIHGADQGCAEVHSQPFNGGFWIETLPGRCPVFLTERLGRPSHFAGAGRHADTHAYRGTGRCTCGGGH